MIEYIRNNNYITENGYVVPIIDLIQVIEHSNAMRMFVLLKDKRVLTCIIDDDNEFGYSFDEIELPYETSCGDEFRSEFVIDVANDKLIKRE